MDRWIDNALAHNGTYTPAGRRHFQLTPDMLDAIARWRGNATAAYRELRAEHQAHNERRTGEEHPPAQQEFPSLATFHRAVNRQLTPGRRAGLRAGEKARRRFDVHGKRPRHHRNYAWETDHVEASVHVLVDGHRRKPWITWFVDCATSAICGLAITPQRPSRESVLVAVRDALLRDEHHGPFGGIPERIRVDGGKEFLCATVREALGAFAVEQIVLPPYCPDGKGTVEAVNGAVKDTLFAGMPGYTEAPTLLGGKPVDPSQPLIHFEAFVAKVREWVHQWNHHPIKDLGNQTPVQAWENDPTPLFDANPDDLHTYTLERHGKPLTINNSGVRWRNRDYINGWMHGRAGEKVVLRYLPHHDHRVELYTPDTHRHLGSAFMAEQATPAQIRDLKRAQRREADRLRAQLKKAEKNRRIRFAAATEPAPPQPLTAMTETEALDQLRDLGRPFDLSAEALPDFLPLPA
ncbi:DDE-type integrase/transposase/recombinase, partial [Streptomyces sp. UNOC14_S4]|nr:DDE-type integrase/transposase/recombinase [Streptomyces sp. UNOC14_S4]